MFVFYHSFTIGRKSDSMLVEIDPFVDLKDNYDVDELIADRIECDRLEADLSRIRDKLGVFWYVYSGSLRRCTQEVQKSKSATKGKESDEASAPG